MCAYVCPQRQLYDKFSGISRLVGRYIVFQQASISSPGVCVGKIAFLVQGRLGEKIQVLPIACYSQTLEALIVLSASGIVFWCDGLIGVIVRRGIG